MKPFVISLSDLQADLNTVGGKGASLARLVRAGLPVPDGFHVTTEAYRYFVNQSNLQTGIETALIAVDINQPQTLETASRRITELFLAASIPDEISTVIEGIPHETPVWVIHEKLPFEPVEVEHLLIALGVRRTYRTV